MKYLFCLLFVVTIIGIVSADTTIFYPTQDLAMYRQCSPGTCSWGTIRSGAGTGSTAAGSNEEYSSSWGWYTYNYRSGLCWNTSTLGSAATITGATISLYGSSKQDSALNSLSSVIVGFTPTNSAALASGDYNKTASSLFAPKITSANWSTSAYNNFTLNAAGIATINKPGISCFAFRSNEDVSGTIVEGNGNNQAFIKFYPWTTAGQTKDEMLTITYTTPDTTPPASITNLANNTATCTAINWNWTNPVNADFNHTYIMKDTVWYANVSNTTSYSNWTGLTGGQTYTISTKTYDTSGNSNLTWVNQSAIPTSCAGAPIASFTTNKNFLRIPNPISVTDTSTPTPTSWQWSWGDGTANSTTQNATHTYTKRGKFNIILSVADFNGGSNTSAPMSVKVVGYENYY